MSLLIAAGGTGGHVFPALAVAQAWRKRWPELPVHWVGVANGREEKWVREVGLSFWGLHVVGWQPRRPRQNLRLLYRLPQGGVEAWRALSRLRPRVVFTTGGYPGLLPGYVAALRGLPVVLLELNVYAGRTIRWLAPVARVVYGAFPHTEGLPRRRSAQWIGVPVRFQAADRSRYTPAQAKASWGLAEDRPLVLILGGSQGSSALNRAVSRAIPAWVEAGASVLWQTGPDAPFSTVSSAVRCEPFILDMVKAYLAADVVVSRAGGSTLGELAWWGKAAVLVPSPYVAEDHQRKNARYWVEQGAAVLVEEKEAFRLEAEVLALLRDPTQRTRYEQAAARLACPNAADVLAEHLYHLAYGLSR